MRGKVIYHVGVDPHRRITPAYAGKRWQRLPPRSERQDHPRLCGEKTNEAITQLGVWGSPPPMRGKAEFRCQGFPEIQDHPRLCGEKFS